MAEQKDGPNQIGKLAQSKRDRVAPDGGTQEERAESTAASDKTSSSDKTSATLVRRKQRYLIGFRSLPGFTQQGHDPFLETLAQMGGVQIIRRLGSTGTAAVQPAAPPQEPVVALMDEQLGEALRQNAPAHVIVEIDAPLGYSDMAVTERMCWPPAVQAMPFPRPRRELRFRILGEGDRPLPNAVVNLYGAGFPVQAITDSAGLASLQTHAINGAAIDAVYVRPAADHWERYIQNPSLVDPGQENVIRLSPLKRTSRRFPGERSYSWGQRMMKFDRVSTDWNGAGTKIGLIDSGCDNSHPLLSHIAHGIDLTQDDDSQGWQLDELGQGTHCAGNIAASTASSSDIVGCSPAAEMHIFKVLPGGYFSDLLNALNQCIERRVDIAVIGVSSEQFSELVAQKIAEARMNGIACIAGVGNSGGPVQFPANAPGVLAVAAVGKLGEYPQDTRHARRALPQLLSFSGIYATNFSCWGPQVGLCAPGVAVVSTVPGRGYAAWDGTSMAASHVAGFSALLLAHHPMLRSINYGTRAEERVSVLYDFLRAAAVPYVPADPMRVGAGIPDLQQVPGLGAAGQPSYAVGAGAGMLQSPYAAAPAFLGNPMNAILQLRAAGLWV